MIPSLQYCFLSGGGDKLKKYGRYGSAKSGLVETVSFVHRTLDMIVRF